MVQFFFEIANMPQAYHDRIFNLVLKSIEVHFPAEELNILVGQLLSGICRKVTRLPVLAINEGRNHQKNYEPKRDYSLGIIRIVDTLIEKDFIMHAWLKSPKLHEDLENLYSLCMPTKDEVDCLVS